MPCFPVQLNVTCAHQSSQLQAVGRSQDPLRRTRLVRQVCKVAGSSSHQDLALLSVAVCQPSGLLYRRLGLTGASMAPFASSTPEGCRLLLRSRLRRPAQARRLPGLSSSVKGTTFEYTDARRGGVLAVLKTRRVSTPVALC